MALAAFQAHPLLRGSAATPSKGTSGLSFIFTRPLTKTPGRTGAGKPEAEALLSANSCVRRLMLRALCSLVAKGCLRKRVCPLEYLHLRVQRQVRGKKIITECTERVAQLNNRAELSLAKNSQERCTCNQSQHQKNGGDLR